MSTLATVPHGGGLAEVAYTREQVDLIKRSICVDATDDELKLFLTRCAKTGLDPFMRQIYSIKRGGKHTIQVGIDGLRLVAVRTNEADGQDGPHWCGEDGVWREVWFDRQHPPAACKVVVFRRGQSRGYTGVAHFGEYFQSGNGLWKSMPAQMLAKCAEALALRKAFPQELSGLYADAEMDQAGPDGPPSKAEFGRLMERKGWSWAAVLDALDRKEGSRFVEAKATFAQVHPTLVADFAVWLREQPDKPADAPPPADQPAA
jgi:phage recombination protein Bet